VPSQPATGEAAPGGASTNHSPGPEPTTSQAPSWLAPSWLARSSRSRPARPNGTPSALAIAPFHGARRWTLASGVQSVIVSAASLRPPLTSQPASTRTGGAGAIGLLARGSDTHPSPFGTHVGELLDHPSDDQSATFQSVANPAP